MSFGVYGRLGIGVCQKLVRIHAWNTEPTMMFVHPVPTDAVSIN